MADDVVMTPVEAAEPPKGSPLGKPAAPVVSPKPAPAAAGLRPGLKLPPKPGLAAGLKLPPKPGVAKAGATVSALRPGLKLPPKPGATVSALRPGLKLPTQTALKPGVKLPPKPVIRKPGATVSSPVLPKPVTAPAAAAVPPAPKPAPAKPVSVDAQGVGKLPTVAAQAVARGEVAPVEMPKPMEALKTVTQKLKGITQEIPQQAILHKTGIVADGASDAQKEAAKHKTARISLSDAMGVAPVRDEAAPMKTIRIKRPIDIPNPTSSLASQPKPPAAAPAGAPAAAPAAAAAAPAASDSAEQPAPAASASVTQRKTLKITRPGGAVRPAGKFGVKRPVSQATTVAKAAPAKPGDATAPADAANAGDAAVADIPDIAPLPPVQALPLDDGPAWPWTLSALIQVAACVAMGVLVWFFYENSQLPTYCGGLGWGA